MATLPASVPWTFTQLGGPKTVLTLSGWQAPFGRARKSKIFNAGTEVKYTRTDYPGNLVPPTIHVFGDLLNNWELHGRWFDAAIGNIGQALALRRIWNKFTSDHQIVRAAWGSYISYQVFITKAEFDIEDPSTIVWRLSAEALSDDMALVSGSFSVPQSDPTPLDLTSQLLGLMAGGNPFEALIGALTQFSNLISGAFAALLAPVEEMYTIAASLSSFSGASLNNLAGLEASCATTTQAINAYTQSTDDLMAQAIAENSPSGTSPNQATFTGNQMRGLCSMKASADSASIAQLALLAQIQLALQKAIRGKVTTAYVAAPGDTWESIATKLLGTPDGARAIKNLNGIKFGTPPTPGQQYSIPQNFTAQGQT